MRKKLKTATNIKMNINQASKVLSLVNVAIDTIQKIALQEQEILGTAHRDHRYIKTILKLQDKKRSVEYFLKGTNNV